MKFLFSDQWLVFKVAIVLGLLVGMGHDLQRRLHKLRPEARELKEQPERYDGVQVWLQHAIVERPERDGFTAFLDPVRIPVLFGQEKPVVSEGDHVTVRGRFQRNGYVKADAVQVLPDYVWRRAAIYAYSVVALGVLVWLLSRGFRARPPLLVVREERSA